MILTKWVLRFIIHASHHMKDELLEFFHANFQGSRLQDTAFKGQEILSLISFQKASYFDVALCRMLCTNYIQICHASSSHCCLMFCIIRWSGKGSVLVMEGKNFIEPDNRLSSRNRPYIAGLHPVSVYFMKTGIELSICMQETSLFEYNLWYTHFVCNRTLN